MIVQDTKCFFCGATQWLHCHHCIPGVANRKKSEQHGLTIWLCAYHHNLGKKSVHQDREMDLQVRRFAQEYFEANIGSRELFLKEFGKSYL
jgi:hypothetical protein